MTGSGALSWSAVGIKSVVPSRTDNVIITRNEANVTITTYTQTVILPTGSDTAYYGNTDNVTIKTNESP